MTGSEVQTHDPSLAGPASDLQRQQSIRFTGPKARLKRNLAPRASKCRSSCGGQDCASEPVVHGQTLKGIAQVHGKGFGFHSLTRNYLRSLKAADADPIGDDEALVPQTGQRKLRKSRSMFTALDGDNSNYFFSSDAPPQPGQVRRSRSRYATLNTQDETSKAAWASDPPSYPFAEAEEDAPRAVPQPARDLAVQLAREKFQQQVEQQQHHHHLKPQSSLFFRSRNKRSESSMALRKSLRNSSAISAGLSSAFSGQSLALSKQAGLRNTARRVSQSLRGKFRGLFNRPKLEEGFSTLQLQDDTGPESGLEDESMTVGEASMSRVASHAPSLHAVPSFQQMKSRKGSMESLDVLEELSTDDKSRVTSWTNSVTNTLPSQSAAGEWERQRLSVIKENGMHISSSSIPRPSQGLSPETMVSSDRVYAALMKRLEESNRPEERFRHQSVENFTQHGIAPPRSSSVEPGETPTIRCITADDDVFSDSKASRPIGTATSASKMTTEELSPPATTEMLPHFSPGYAGQGSQRSVKSKTVSHRSSAFFGSPSTHLFRTTSPYRRALQQEMGKPELDADNATSGQCLGIMSPLGLPPRRPSTIGSENWHTKASEGSVYSCKDDEAGKNPWYDGSVVVDHFPRPPTANNSPSCSRLRDASAVSSVEWKRWLSADVARAEESHKLIKSLGHVREQAEIESPDDRQRHVDSKIGGTSHNTPLRIIPPNSRSSSAQKGQRNAWESSLQRTENDRPSTQFTHLDATHKTPPIPTRSALRVIPSTQLSGATPGSRSLSGNSPEHWPLADPIKPTSSCGPSTRAGQRMRSRLDNVMTISPQSSPLLQESLQRPSTASPGHRSNWTLDKTLHRLHLRDSVGKTHSGYDALSSNTPEVDPQVLGSKRMVDLFLSSRRKKGQWTRSRSTSDSSHAFL